MESCTFVETDIHGFKELVQKLTGLPEGTKLPLTIPARNSKKGSPVAGTKSDFKIQKRNKAQRKLEIELGLSDPHNRLLFECNGYVSSSPVMLSPVTPLEPNLFTCYSQSCSSCEQSSCLRKEEKEKFSFGDSPNSVKSKPKLLPLFPLHSATQLTNS
ncbi:VQ motif-containing protein 11 [Cryptomeria japonica]|uniref:VQ motif-containing protein 11 n=1 Tax=Cryptomeria japonica TaxID=3369 RepID=UPI0027DA447C|nr:VQ motif-containing protein 11 [Cryptomeria japonica]